MQDLISKLVAEKQEYVEKVAKINTKLMAGSLSTKQNQLLIIEKDAFNTLISVLDARITDLTQTGQPVQPQNSKVVLFSEKITKTRNSYSSKRSVSS